MYPLHFFSFFLSPRHVFSSKPVLLRNLEKYSVYRVKSGAFHAVCVTESGEVACWGLNDRNQLGVTGIESSSVPIVLEALATTKVSAVAAGDNHTLALLADGSVVAWGDNDFGQLGRESSSRSPKKVVGLPNERIIQIAAGGSSSYALTAKGEVYAWGANDSSQLGITPTVGSEAGAAVRKPRIVEGLFGRPIIGVAAGARHAMAVTLTGKIFSWGTSRKGALGLGPEISHSLSPQWVQTSVLANHHIVRLALGADHSLALTDRGDVFAWGQGKLGATGLDTERVTHSPRRIEGLDSVSDIAAANNHSIVLTSAGEVYTFGYNGFGQLGLGDEAVRFKPTIVESLKNVDVRRVFAGASHCYAVAKSSVDLNDSIDLESAPAISTEPALTSPPLSPGPSSSQVDLSDIVADAMSSNPPSTSSLVSAAGGEGEEPATKTKKKKRFWRLDSFRSNFPIPSISGMFRKKSSKSSSKGKGPARPTGDSAPATSTASSAYPVTAGGTLHAFTPPSSSDPLLVEAMGSLTPPLTPVNLMSLQIEDVRTLCASAKESGNYAPLIATLQFVFSTPACLNASFLTPAGRYSAPLPVISRRPTTASSIEEHLGDLPADGDLGLKIPNAAASRVTQISPKAQNSGVTPDEVGLDPSGAALPDGGVVPSEDDGRPRVPPPPPSVLPAGLFPWADKERALLNHDFQLDLEAVREAYRLLGALKHRGVSKAIRDATRMLVTQVLANHTPFSASVDSLRMFFIILENPTLDNDQDQDAIVEPLAKVIATHAQVSQALFVDWFIHYDSPSFARVVNLFRNTITAHMKIRSWNFSVDIAAPCMVLMLLVLANDNAPRPHVHFSFFYHSVISSTRINLQDDYRRWKTAHRSPRRTFTFCHYPFLFDAAAKSRLLHFDAQIQMSLEVNAAVISSLFGNNQTIVSRLKVRRDHLLEDTLMQIARDGFDPKKPLRIEFAGEDGVDEGGPKKEFFQLLVKELFRPEFGMWDYDEETRTYWFSHNPVESGAEYGLVGMLLGLAIYNGVILDVHFPMVLYKKLMGVKPTFVDLIHAFPGLGNGLKSLLEYEGDDMEDVFGTTFEVSYQVFGEAVTEPLKPGGDNILVNRSNRSEYILAYTDWKLNKSCENDYYAFYRGFTRVCGGAALSLFRPEELELLICGSPEYVFQDLQKSVEYVGYSAGSNVIRWFWEIVLNWDEDMKRKLLQFVTSSDRVPIGGLSQLKIIIQRGGSELHLPSSHTCVNHLVLPPYRSKALLREKLELAVQHSRGFGLA